METTSRENSVKASAFITKLSPEDQQAIKEIAAIIEPALNEIHATPPTTKNYYGDYLRLLSYRPERAKIMVLAMIYLGVNPDGLQAAVKLL